MLILLVTSPRVAPGLLTLQAWDALRDAARVLARPGHPLRDREMLTWCAELIESVSGEPAKP